VFAGRRTRKGVTGYDIASLLVGSEGTLALFGDVTLKLIKRPESTMTVLATFDDPHHAARGALEIIAQGLSPSCLEFLDSATLDAVRRAGNPLDSKAGAPLLMDVDGSERVVEEQVDRLGAALELVGAREVLAASDAGQRHRLWAARREMSRAIRRMAKHKLSEDVVVPRTKIPQLLDEVRRLGDQHQVRLLTYGHAGDGNVHVNFIWDTPDEKPRIDRAIFGLMQAVVALGGTLSGEHGIGVLKAPFLPLEQSRDLIALERDVKRVFDPQNLLNPGKIFPTRGHGAC
jgi:glycolate oxidase